MTGVFARDGMLRRMTRTPTTDARRGFREGLLLQVFVAGQLTGDLLRGELGPSMSGDRFAVLSVIGALGPITPGELARRLGMAPTTVSTWLARLERDGATSRRPKPEVTESGRAELQEAMPAFRRALERVRDELGEDLDDVLSGLERLVEALRIAVAETTTS